MNYNYAIITSLKGGNMYKISVPAMCSNVFRSDRERLLKEIKRFGAERIFLALDTYKLDPTERQKCFDELADNCKFFKDHGFEVGAWTWTFWIKGNKEFTNMRAIDGGEIKEFMCPTDQGFVNFAAEYIAEIAKCGVDLIQFDDDYRYGFLADTPACLCDNHIKIINDSIGENLTREEIKNHILTGDKNKVRDAYLKANGDAFRDFALKMREAVDSVNPNIRLGACACMTSWDIDGTDAYELAKILAGGTKPFVRLIGAPYWAWKREWGNKLQDVIELERMESAWTKHPDIEIMAEGDVFPRPRMNGPAAYLECFDTAIRASGCTDGILKYGIDYNSNADYETTYALFHERNKDIYASIDKMFGGKEAVGVRVYESMKKVGDMKMPTKVNSRVDLQEFIFSKASRTLAECSIPTVFEGEGICGAVFDENARNLPLSALENGLILDIAAAEILTERGIDVGLNEIGSYVGEVLDFTANEHFLHNNNHIAINNAMIYDVKLNEKAEVLSDVSTSRGLIPVSYRYENANGNRFLVININTRFGGTDILRHYERSRQYAKNIPWLSGKELPAYIYGHPSLYVLCKKGENSMSIGLWNLFPDRVIDPCVQLDKAYKSIEFINSNGKLEGDKVYLSDIPAFEFAFFEVRN